jgi:hypothetical protein
LNSAQANPILAPAGEGVPADAPSREVPTRAAVLSLASLGSSVRSEDVIETFE